MSKDIKTDFFIFEMGPTRPADYCLGYDEGSVYIDFNNCEDNRIRLKRISFDRYGSCDLGMIAVPMDQSDSQKFKAIISAGVNGQVVLREIVLRCIAVNADLIWKDALTEYDLL